MPKRITVVEENSKGRNTRFRDNVTGNEMNRAEFVRQIKNGKYPAYHFRKVNGIETPASNPDTRRNNNLG